MMNGNKGQPDLLDRVLAGKSDDVKARVLELVYRLGIDSRDELFLVMIALGQLQILVEDAPNAWENLFFDFKNELNTWTDTNLDALDSLIRKAETEEMLAKSSQQLVSALANLTVSCNQLMKELQMSAQSSRNSSSTANTSWESNLLPMKQDMTVLREQGDRLSRSINDLTQKLSDSQQQVRRLWLGLSAAGVMLLVLGWNLWGTVADTNQRVKWILEKEIKQECLAGRKAKNSAECAGLQ